MKNKFTYKGFKVERRTDPDIGDYYFACNGEDILNSGGVLVPDYDSLKKARHYIKWLIDQYWAGAKHRRVDRTIEKFYKWVNDMESKYEKYL